MLRQLEDQYRHEDRDLAPYAIHNLTSKGRRFPEAPHPFRTDFQRDRDRILHSKAFRRLEYKTQVFLNGKGDHLRTRLTHTIEVAAISRTIARALYLNEDLAETIALAHDLGHTPFGHSGEYALNELLKDHGGFDHNAHALRVVDELELKYPDYNGLNLTWEVREGLVKHREKGSEVKLDGKLLLSQPFLESQIADLADDLTYYGHDVDDGLEAGLINEKMLSEIEIWNLAAEKASRRGMRIIDGDDKSRAYTVRCLVDMMVENAVLNSERNISEQQINSPADAQNKEHRIIAFDSRFQKMTLQLREFLAANVYHHPEVETANNAAVAKMKKLYLAFVENPGLMGKNARARITSDGIHTAASDFISGMTDRYALIEYEKFFGNGT